MNPIERILNDYPAMILDGAFATELEKRGCDLDDPLWSAKILIESPEVISAVHEDYFSAGADCTITASYQATFEGFMQRGLSEHKASELLALSVSLAKAARDRFWQNKENRNKRPKPLVAASIGPYGAYLADGSEYRGDYKIDKNGLTAFHKKRMHTLIQAEPDILACETIPCLDEAKSIIDILKEYPDTYCWISFSAKDGKHLNNGEPIQQCAAWLNDYRQVAAIGVNCTAPEHIESLINEIGLGTEKPIIVYPNSGETYSAKEKAWSGKTVTLSFGEKSRIWFEKGARIIGGCCRTNPNDIREISRWARDNSISN